MESMLLVLMSVCSVMNLFEGSTIRAADEVADLIADWDKQNFSQRQKTLKSLAAMGAKAVPPITKLIEDNDRRAAFAMQTLAEMGDAARPALPTLIKLAQDKDAKNPEGWTWNVPIRSLLFSNLRKMSWASGELLPVLQQVGNDTSETDQLRSSAVGALGGMGPKAEPALTEFMLSDVASIRSRAANAIASIQTKAGKSKAQAWSEVIERNPFDSNVPDYIASAKGMYNSGKLDPLTQRIKKLHRDKLAEKPDAQIAWQLATIIISGLSRADLQWASPTNSYRQMTGREDPNESFETLAEVLGIVLEHTGPKSELHNKAGLSLARLRLLQGDWSGMNAMLRKLGQQPVPADLRPNLSAPPSDWKNLKDGWQLADKSMRSGDCGIEFRFVRRGRKLTGVKGVHVLVKLRPEPERVWSTGVRVDTLFFATMPFGQEPFGGFGYRGADRHLTRYGISNENGVVRIENLPNKPMKVEFLVPTGNFAEVGHKWDLLMATSDGAKSAMYGTPDAVDPNKPPALIELKEGKTVRSPMFFIQSKLTTAIGDWQAVDPANFVLKWSNPRELEIESYKLNLSLSAPMQFPSMAERTPKIVTQTIKTTEPSWSIGERGVGNLKLAPGNIYAVQVEAVRGGTTVASTSIQRIWVPWTHRKCDAPKSGRGGFGNGPSFYNDIWLRTSANGRPLEERLPEAIESTPSMFETEYYQLCMAWLDLHKNKVGATDKLRELLKLPPGNIVRSSAQSLLDAHKDGLAIPKRFKFVAE